MTRAMLIDISKCLGCNACTQACKMANNIPEGVFRSKIHQHETGAYPAVSLTFTKHSCKHCVEPGCASACPVGALYKTADGPVVYDSKKCIGCRYCMNACPYGVPSFDWDKGLLEAPVINKCTFCVDRDDGGEGPACAEVCPFGAITFGERDELLAQAHTQIQNNPERYVDHVYGETEAGGTSMLYVSNVPPEQMGLPALGPEPIAQLSESVMEGTIPFAVGWGAVLTGIYGIALWRERRMSKKQAAVKQVDKEV